jgi:hypothetical protein
VGSSVDTKRLSIARDTGDISFYEDTGTTAKLFWDASAESLGIGIASPAAKLDVSASSGTLFRAEYAGIAQLNIGNGGASTNYYDANTQIFRSGSGSESMRISSGNLLVGKTSSSSSVAGFMVEPDGDTYITAEGVEGRVLYLNRLSSDGDIIQFYKDGSTVGSIGTYLNASYMLGSSSKGIFLNGNLNPAGAGGAIDDNTQNIGATNRRWKDLHLSGTANAANFNTTSDATLKTNVETLTGSLDAVKSLRGVSYDWIESGGSEIGVIAQEVEAVLPDVVSTNDEGIKSVKYGNMVAVLIEAIKEQQVQIDELKSKLGE